MSKTVAFFLIIYMTSTNRFKCLQSRSSLLRSEITEQILLSLTLKGWAVRFYLLLKAEHIPLLFPPRTGKISQMS